MKQNICTKYALLLFYEPLYYSVQKIVPFFSSWILALGEVQISGVKLFLLKREDWTLFNLENCLLRSAEGLRSTKSKRGSFTIWFQLASMCVCYAHEKFLSSVDKTYFSSAPPRQVKVWQLWLSHAQTPRSEKFINLRIAVANSLRYSVHNCGVCLSNPSSDRIINSKGHLIRLLRF